MDEIIKRIIETKSHKAFSVKKETVETVKKFERYLKIISPDLKDVPTVFPISTVQRKSEIIRVNGQYVLLLDQEKINALLFFYRDSIFMERPVFSLVESLIRTGERLATQYRQKEALQIAEIAHALLKADTEHLDSHPYIHRNIINNNLSLEDMDRRLNLFCEASETLNAFIYGHEMGHFYFKNSSEFGDFFETVRKSFEDDMIVERDAGPRIARYFEPSIEFSINSKRECVKLASRGVPLIKTAFGLFKPQEEAIADAFGIVMATLHAISCEIRPESFLATMEQLFSLSDLLAHMDIAIDQALSIRKSKVFTSNDTDEVYPATFPETLYFYRKRMLYHSILNIISGALCVPKEVRAYWQSNPVLQNYIEEGLEDHGRDINMQKMLHERAFLEAMIPDIRAVCDGYNPHHVQDFSEDPVANRLMKDDVLRQRAALTIPAAYFDQDIIAGIDPGTYRYGAPYVIGMVNALKIIYKELSSDVTLSSKMGAFYESMDQDQMYEVIRHSRLDISNHEFSECDYCEF